MNAKVLIKYWRTILIVAEMTLRQQLTDGFIIFTILKTISHHLGE